jgi:predicted deacetylase
MRAKYLVRFDDLCPTMNWETWAAIEKILIESGVKPILAVVPDNQDAHLQVAPAHPQFWQEVRRWQNQGWTIGLHGYQHRYVTAEAGIIGLNNYSEFAGLPPEEQEAKLQNGLEIFRREGVNAEVWIAPAHSFDAETVGALKKSGVHFINDGFFIFPRVDAHGILWVPQQLWGFRPAPLGVWTVCFHHNEWSPEDLANFRNDIKNYKNTITSFNEVINAYKDRRRSWIDLGLDRLFLAAISLKRRRRHWRQEK